MTTGTASEPKWQLASRLTHTDTWNWWKLNRPNIEGVAKQFCLCEREEWLGVWDHGRINTGKMGFRGFWKFVIGCFFLKVKNIILNKNIIFKKNTIKHISKPSLKLFNIFSLCIRVYKSTLLISFYLFWFWIYQLLNLIMYSPEC